MSRSDEIKKIEQNIIQLSQLVTQLSETVEQHAPAVENIDQGAERVAGDLGNANVQLGQAVQSARNARKWKWYALIIVSKYHRPKTHRHKTNDDTRSHHNCHHCGCCRWCHADAKLDVTFLIGIWFGFICGWLVTL